MKKRSAFRLHHPKNEDDKLISEFIINLNEASQAFLILNKSKINEQDSISIIVNSLFGFFWYNIFKFVHIINEEDIDKFKDKLRAQCESYINQIGILRKKKS